MKYPVVHIKNIDNYNPGYRDRQHIWSKIYWSIFLDEHFQGLDEVDRYRLISLIIHETYTKKPVPLTKTNLNLLGWDANKRAIALTLQMLHKFIDTVTEPVNACNASADQSSGSCCAKQDPCVSQSRVEESRVEESRVDKNRIDICGGSLLAQVLVDFNTVFNPAKPYTLKTIGSNNLALINARLGDGHTLEDFQHVHRVMKSLWDNDDMRKFLRPSTLYKPKFAEYRAMRLKPEVSDAWEAHKRRQTADVGAPACEADSVSERELLDILAAKDNTAEGRTSAVCAQEPGEGKASQ